MVGGMIGKYKGIMVSTTYEPPRPVEEIKADMREAEARCDECTIQDLYKELVDRALIEAGCVPADIVWTPAIKDTVITGTLKV